MSNIENILSDFASFVEKSASLMNAVANNTAGGSTAQSGQSPATPPQAGQPVARVNETNAISTQQNPPLNTAVSKTPTSNAAPKKIDFKAFT